MIVRWVKFYNDHFSQPMTDRPSPSEMKMAVLVGYSIVFWERKNDCLTFARCHRSFMGSLNNYNGQRGLKCVWLRLRNDQLPDYRSTVVQPSTCFYRTCVTTCNSSTSWHVVIPSLCHSVKVFHFIELAKVLLWAPA